MHCIALCPHGCGFARQDEGPQLKRMSHRQKGKVESIWQEMNEEYAQFTAEKHRNAAHAQLLDGDAEGAARRRRKRGKLQEFMASVFGSSRATAVEAAAARPKRKVEETQADGDEEQPAKRASSLRRGKETVTETRKFAGQEITYAAVVGLSCCGLMIDETPAVRLLVLFLTCLCGNACCRITRTLKAGESAPQQQAKAAAKGLDKVLEELQGPKAISTVAKSSIDWDNFKEAEGLEDELAKAQKDGYVENACVGCLVAGMGSGL